MAVFVEFRRKANEGEESGWIHQNRATRRRFLFLLNEKMKMRLQLSIALWILSRGKKLKLDYWSVCFEVTSNWMMRKFGLNNTNRRGDNAIRFVCHQRGRSGCRISRNELEPIKMPDIPQDFPQRFSNVFPSPSLPWARVACSRPSCPEK